jgi:hypothetical protein
MTFLFPVMSDFIYCQMCSYLLSEDCLTSVRNSFVTCYKCPCMADVLEGLLILADNVPELLYNCSHFCPEEFLTIMTKVLSRRNAFYSSPIQKKRRIMLRSLQSIRLLTISCPLCIFWTDRRKLKLLGRNVNHNKAKNRVQVWPFWTQDQSHTKSICVNFKILFPLSICLTNKRKWNYLADILRTYNEIIFRT